MVLDPKVWNFGNVAPTADRPLLIVFKGHIPSLKNNRTVGVSKAGQVFNRPKVEVTQAIARIRDTLDRQLPVEWRPIQMPQQVSIWAVVGAHAATSIPDSDIDNLIQTSIEALAAPRQKDKMSEDRRTRLIMEDDRQVVSLHPFRRSFKDKDRIYHEVYIWLSGAEGDPMKDLEEYHHVALLRQENILHPGSTGDKRSKA